MTPPSPPLRYSDALERLEPDEAETAAALRDSLRGILETTSADYRHAPRSVHAKAHAVVRGRLSVADGLPPELAQGLFAAPGTYDAVLRFSTAPGDILDDSVTTPHGVAIKLIGVTGERLDGEETGSQDFVMVNGPTFAAPTAKKFLGNLKLLAASTDKAEVLKKALSAVLRTTEAALEAVGGESAMLKNMGGAPPYHPLGETYFTQTAYRYGDHVAKLSLAPASPNLTELDGSKVSVIGRPDALREVCSEVFVEQLSTWSLRVQLCTDPETMPIEDPTVVWDEAASPFVEVARLAVPPQQGWVLGETDRVEDSLSFSPWHGLAAHRPLGAINRVRREAYEMSADFRSRFNGCPIRELAPQSDLQEA